MLRPTVSDWISSEKANAFLTTKSKNNILHGGIHDSTGLVSFHCIDKSDRLVVVRSRRWLVDSITCIDPSGGAPDNVKEVLESAIRKYACRRAGTIAAGANN